MELERLAREPFELARGPGELRLRWSPWIPRVADPAPVAVATMLGWGGASLAAVLLDSPAVMLVPLALAALFVLWAATQRRFTGPDRLWVRGPEIWVESLTARERWPLAEVQLSVHSVAGRQGYPGRSSIVVAHGGEQLVLFRDALRPHEAHALMAELTALQAAAPEVIEERAQPVPEALAALTRQAGRES